MAAIGSTMLLVSPPIHTSRSGLPVIASMTVCMSEP